MSDSILVDSPTSSGPSGRRSLRAVQIGILGLALTLSACMNGGEASRPRSLLVEAPSEQYLRVMSQGREAELHGPIRKGSAEALGRLMAENPGLRTIHLNSGGGLVVEALKMSRLIDDNGLDTYVATECLSACTIAYLGGREQYLNPGARIGFHSSSAPYATLSDLEEVNSRLAKVAVAAGVDVAFADKAYRWPHDGMWFPTAKELIDAHVVTRISEGQFALSGFGPIASREAMAKALNGNPLFASVAKARPAMFDRLIEIYLAGVVSSQSETETMASARAVLDRVLTELVPTASDDALIGLGEVVVDQITLLRGIDKRACRDHLFGDATASLSATRKLSPELRQRELRATELVVASGAAGAVVPEASLAPFEPSLRLVYDRVRQKHGKAMADRIGTMSDSSRTADPADACDVSWAYLSEIMKLPKPDAASLLRRFLSA